MSQTPPNGPTPVPGGQPNPAFPQPGYQPPTAAPAGAGAPPPPVAPGAQPGGYPNPAAFPPGGYPQQPMPPAGMPPQGGYPMPPGYPPAPQGKASSSKVLLVVIAAVVALALIGGGIMLMSKTPSTPQVPTPPSQPAQPSTPATTAPTQAPTEQPTEQPTQPTEQPTQPTGSAIDLGHGVQFVVADGWQIARQDAASIKVVDGSAALITVVDQVEPNTNAGQLCDGYNRSLLKDVSGAKFAKAEKVSVQADNLTVAKCLAGFIDASGGSSTQMYVQSFAAVRTTDGVVSVSTVVFTKATPQTSFDAVNDMLGVVLGTQAAG